MAQTPGDVAFPTESYVETPCWGTNFPARGARAGPASTCHITWHLDNKTPTAVKTTTLSYLTVQALGTGHRLISRRYTLPTPPSAPAHYTIPSSLLHRENGECMTDGMALHRKGDSLFRYRSC